MYGAFEKVPKIIISPISVNKEYPGQFMEVWNSWQRFWGWDYVAIVIAIALSQLSVTISGLLMQRLFHSKFFQTHKDQKWTSPFDNSVRQLRALALEIDAAIEFPILAAIHPMIVAGTFKDASQVPEKGVLVAQTLLFLVLDLGIQRPIRETITIAMGRDEASRLAVDILHPRAVLFSTIFLVQALEWLGKGNGFGTLHFVSIWLWLLVRRIFV